MMMNVIEYPEYSEQKAAEIDMAFKEMTPEQKAQRKRKRIYTNGTLIQKLQLKYIYFL